MHVLTTAKTLGLEADEHGEIAGTIEEGMVLAALEELSAALPDHADLFILASDRVRNARSAQAQSRSAACAAASKLFVPASCSRPAAARKFASLPSISVSFAFT